MLEYLKNYNFKTLDSLLYLLDVNLGKCNKITVCELPSLNWICHMAIIDFIFNDKYTPFVAKLELGRVCWKFFKYLSELMASLSLLDCRIPQLERHINTKYCILKNVKSLKIHTNTNWALIFKPKAVEILAPTIETIYIYCHTQFKHNIMDLFISKLTNLKHIYLVMPRFDIDYIHLFQGFPVAKIETFSFKTEEPTFDYDDYLFSSNPSRLREYTGLLKPGLVEMISPYLSNLTKIALQVHSEGITERFVSNTLPLAQKLKSLRLTVNTENIHYNQLSECLIVYLSDSGRDLEHLHLVGNIMVNDTLLTTITGMARLKTLSVPARLITRPVKLCLSKLTIYEPSKINQCFLDEKSIVKRVVIKDNFGDTPSSVYSYLKNNIHLQYIKEVYYNNHLINAIKNKPATSSLRTIEIKVPYSSQHTLTIDKIFANIAQCHSINNVRLSQFDNIDTSQIYSGFKFFTYCEEVYHYIKVK